MRNDWVKGLSPWEPARQSPRPMIGAYAAGSGHAHTFGVNKRKIAFPSEMATKGPDFKEDCSDGEFSDVVPSDAGELASNGVCKYLLASSFSLFLL